MYFIILIVIVYLLYSSDNWLALLIKNYWWQSWLVYSAFYFIIIIIKERQQQKEYEIRKKQEQEEYERQQNQERENYERQLQGHFDYLFYKYHDEQIVQWIMDGTFWIGETQEQLIDSLGQPEKIDEKVLKSKRLEIWRYHKINQRSFGLSITLEDGVVVGWEMK